MSTFTVNCLDSKAHFETVSFDNIEYNSVNDYSMTSIEELADNIKKNGLWLLRQETPASRIPGWILGFLCFWIYSNNRYRRNG